MYLRSADKLTVVDDNGGLKTSIALENGDSVIVAGGDGQAYLASNTETGADISLIGEDGLEPALSVPIVDAWVCGGNEEFLFTYLLNDGLYGIDAEGNSTPIIIWKDCRLTVENFSSLVPMPDGVFLLKNQARLSLLTPVDPSEMREAITLTLATVGGKLYNEYDFNISNGDYFVEIKDYSKNGTVSREDALMQLSTDIIVGDYPDMLLLDGMPVYTYIDRGYLTELGTLMEQDPQFSIEDIAIADQLTMSGGIYLLGQSFGIDTRVGLYSNFGDATGWTLDEYLEIDSTLSGGAEMMYNVTKPYFLRTLCSRYMQEAIDWETGTCDFDNEQFISLLEAVNSIRETPEPTNFAEIDYTPHETRLNSGTLYAAMGYIGSVTALANWEKRVGQRVSLVGMPTPDGSCGSELDLSIPIGIFSESENKEGCWEFIKYLLTSYDIENLSFENSRMPVYAPYLEIQLERALNFVDEDGEALLTEDGAKRFRAILDGIDRVSIYDETVLDIIENETAAFFAGDKSATETAKIIQSMVGIYVAEQG